MGDDIFINIKLCQNGHFLNLISALTFENVGAQDKNTMGNMASVTTVIGVIQYHYIFQIQ